MEAISNLGIEFYSNWIEYFVVIPAEAGIQAILNLLKTLDSLFQGNDENRLSVTFYESTKCYNISNMVPACPG